MAFSFIWDEKYSVGVKGIDEQHKKLIETISRLNVAISDAATVEKVVGEIFVELGEYVKYHFTTEEKYFEKFGYEFASEHVAEHQAFIEKVTAMEKRYLAHESDVSFELIDFLEDWLIDHVMTSDRKYIECFAKNGLK